MSNVQLIQLQTGQFLVGDVEAGDDGTITIKEPLETSIQPVQTPNGVQPQVGMFPYAPFAKEPVFTFRKDQVQLGPIEPEENCANHWRQATSGIKAASAADMPPDPTETKSGLLLQG